MNTHIKGSYNNINSNYQTIIIGGGPSTLVFLLSILRQDKMFNIVSKGLAILEKNILFGNGNIENYVINSITPALDFLRLIIKAPEDQNEAFFYDCIDNWDVLQKFQNEIPMINHEKLQQKMELYCMPVLKYFLRTQIYQDIIKYGFQQIPLKIIGQYFRILGSLLLYHIYSLKKQKIFKPFTEVKSIHLLTNGRYEIKTISKDNNNNNNNNNKNNQNKHLKYNCRNVIICMGTTINCKISNLKAKNQIQAPLVHSEEFLGEEGYFKAKQFLKQINTQQQLYNKNKKNQKQIVIDIIGGSHSAFSCALLLLYGRQENKNKNRRRASPLQCFKRNQEICEICCQCGAYNLQQQMKKQQEIQIQYNGQDQYEKFLNKNIQSKRGSLNSIGNQSTVLKMSNQNSQQGSLYSINTQFTGSQQSQQSKLKQSLQSVISQDNSPSSLKLPKIGQKRYDSSMRGENKYSKNNRSINSMNINSNNVYKSQTEKQDEMSVSILSQKCKCQCLCFSSSSQLNYNFSLQKGLSSIDQNWGISGLGDDFKIRILHKSDIVLQKQENRFNNQQESEFIMTHNLLQPKYSEEEKQNKQYEQNYFNGLQGETKQLYLDIMKGKNKDLKNKIEIQSYDNEGQFLQYIQESSFIIQATGYKSQLLNITSEIGEPLQFLRYKNDDYQLDNFNRLQTNQGSLKNLYVLGIRNTNSININEQYKGNSNIEKIIWSDTLNELSTIPKNFIKKIIYHNSKQNNYNEIQWSWFEDEYVNENDISISNMQSITQSGHKSHNLQDIQSLQDYHNLVSSQHYTGNGYENQNDNENEAFWEMDDQIPNLQQMGQKVLKQKNALNFDYIDKIVQNANDKKQNERLNTMPTKRNKKNSQDYQQNIEQQEIPQKFW